MQKRLNLANSIASAALTLKRVQSGATGLMGQERGAAGARAEYAVMLAKQKAAKQELKLIRTQIYNCRGRTIWCRYRKPKRLS